MRVGRAPDDAQVGLERAQLLIAEGRLADAWRETLTLESKPAELGRLLDRVKWRIRVRLRDGQWILDNATNPRDKAFGAVLAGDTRLGVELVDGDPLLRSNGASAFGNYIPVHLAAGDIDPVIAYYEAEIKTPKNVMQAADFCACSPLPLVIALKEAGHPDFRPLLDAWESELEGRRELFGRGATWNEDRGDVAALEGDFAAAKEFYDAAVDAGWRNPVFLFDRFSFLPRDPEFDAILSRVIGLINAERQSLGMPPLENRYRT